MNASRSTLIAIALICLGLLGFALYLQIVRGMLPCPLCILQRYAFLAVAIFCLIGAFLNPTGARLAAGLGLLGALAGAGVAAQHLWVKAHPNISCGIDPLETSLNTIPTAKMFPVLFQADGLCSADYEPIFTLSIPQWSMLWFVLIIVVLGRLLWKTTRA